MLILFTHQWLLQSVLSAVLQESSCSALLTICWMVSCDYSPHRQKKEGEISSPVVSDLHPLSISSARLTSARPSATEHVQQLEAMLYIHESNKTENTQRDCCDLLRFSHFFFSLHHPSFICDNMMHILTLISRFTYIIQNARDVI